jgi:hypothetical protein
MIYPSVMKGSRGFINKAKSGTKALPDRWRRAAEKAKLDRIPKPAKPRRKR